MASATGGTAPSFKPDPAPGTPAILASGVNVTVSGVVVINKDETSNGAASVAMTAASSNLTLSRTVLVAGNGGRGASRPPVGSPAGTPVGIDPCPPQWAPGPGGAASDSPWGQVDLGTFRWVAGIGGAGSAIVREGVAGGQQGGASIGLLLVNSAVVTTGDHNFIIAGFGGAGGAGQAGPSGQLAASGGAGGNGGPSIGIASINSAGVPGTDTYSYANAAGGPGAGGQAGVDDNHHCRGDRGADGVPGGSATAYQFAIPNTLMPGESLAGGQSLYSPDLSTQLILRDNSDLCVVSAGGKQLWCSGTAGWGIYQATMQRDGNFCMFPTRGDLIPIARALICIRVVASPCRTAGTRNSSLPTIRCNGACRENRIVPGPRVARRDAAAARARAVDVGWPRRRPGTGSGDSGRWRAADMPAEPRP